MRGRFLARRARFSVAHGTNGSAAKRLGICFRDCPTTAEQRAAVLGAAYRGGFSAICFCATEDFLFCSATHVAKRFRQTSGSLAQMAKNGSLVCLPS